MNATDKFLACYIEPGQPEIPIKFFDDVIGVQSLNALLLEIEIGEAATAQEFGHLRFVG